MYIICINLIMLGKCINVDSYPGGIWGDTCNHYRLLPVPRWGGGPTDLQQPSWGPGCVSGFRDNPPNTQIIPTYQENFTKHDSQGRGADQGGDYQFDIYRSMKQHNQVFNLGLNLRSFILTAAYSGLLGQVQAKEQCAVVALSSHQGSLFRMSWDFQYLYFMQMTIAGEVHYSNKTKKTSKLHKSGRTWESCNCKFVNIHLWNEPERANFQASQKWTPWRSGCWSSARLLSGWSGRGRGWTTCERIFIFWRRLFWSVTDVIVYLPPAIVLKTHGKRLRADDVVKHYQISSTNVIILWIQQLCWRHTWREGD